MASKASRQVRDRTDAGKGLFGGEVKHAVHVSSEGEVAIKVLDKERIQKQSMGSQIKKRLDYETIKSRERREA